MKSKLLLVSCFIAIFLLMGCLEQQSVIDPHAKKTPVTAEEFKSITKNNNFEVSEDSGLLTASFDVNCGNNGIQIFFVDCKNSNLADVAYNASRSEFLNTLKRNSIGKLNEKEETFANGKKYTLTLGLSEEDKKKTVTFGDDGAKVASYVYIVDNTVVSIAPFRCKEYKNKVNKILSEFKY